jgi:hypothetical protein
MTLVVRAFPLKPECTVEQVQALIAQLQGPRKQDIVAMHRAHGVTHESWYLQQTPHGYWVIAIDQVEGDVQGSARQFAQDNGGFVGWFKDRVLELTGVDMTQAPLGPPTTPIYEWSADEHVARLFQPYQA